MQAKRHGGTSRGSRETLSGSSGREPSRPRSDGEDGERVREAFSRSVDPAANEPTMCGNS